MSTKWWNPVGPEPRGFTRREDPPPTVYGRGEALTILPASVPGMHLVNPPPAPPPEPMVGCIALEHFSLGQQPDGTVKDVVPGEAFEVPARRARHLVHIRRAQLEPDRAAIAMQKAEREHEQREQIAVASRIAAGPTPAPPSPHVRRDAYGREVSAVPEQTVRVKVVRSFCLGEGRDAQTGDVVELELKRALGMIVRGTVVEAPEAQA